MSFLTDSPVLLVGAPNSGKKSMVELLAKNMRNKTQYYSIRYRDRTSFGPQLEKPFRKLVTLEGVMMKSMSASKKLLICVEDL